MTHDHNQPRRQILIGSLLLASALPFAVASCGSGDSNAGGSSGGTQAAAKPVTITAEDRANAKVKFDTLCFTCHGKTGAGDGPGSAGLVPKPRDFQDPDWQSSVTDEHIEKIIVGGGAAVGKALTMPPNPDLKSKPGVVAALREHIRGLNKKQ